MKNTLIISAFILTSAAFSQAESSFKYDLVGIHYGHYSYDDDDVDANGISFSLINEISPRVLIGVSGVTAQSEYTFSNHKIRTTGIGLGFDIGTYVPINNKLDLVGTIGFGRVSYDTKISGSLVNEKESDKTTIASMDLGARIHLDQNQKIELHPSFGISRSDGETSKDFDIELGVKVTPTSQLVIGYSTPVNSDSDLEIYSAGFNIYY